MSSTTPFALALSKETSRFVREMLDGIKVKADLESVILAGHALRMLRFVEAIELLVEAGHMEQACALTRTVVEAGWVALAIDADPTKFDAWLSDANHSGRGSIRRLKDLQVHERGEGLSDAEIDAAITSIPEGKKHTVKDWAAAAGTPQAYVTIYQTLSGYSHAEMQSAAQYVNWSEAGEPLSVREPDLGNDPADCLNICVALMHDICRSGLGANLSSAQHAALDALEARRASQTRRLDELRVAGD